MRRPQRRNRAWTRRTYRPTGVAAAAPGRSPATRPIGNHMARPEFPTYLTRPQEGFYTSEVPAPRGWPLRTFLPTGYEPNYPYPLLVFLHGHGGSDEQILRLAPRLSRRNYICIGLRGPHPAA